MYNRYIKLWVIIENNDTLKGYGRKKNIQAQFQIQHEKTDKKIDFSLV